MLAAFEELRSLYDLPSVSGALQQRTAVEAAVKPRRSEAEDPEHRVKAA